jgi:DNA-binding NarL/FixJ family response regulator
MTLTNNKDALGKWRTGEGHSPRTSGNDFLEIQPMHQDLLEPQSAFTGREPVFLTARQQQISDLLIQGCDNAEIARVLEMKPRTVKAHFHRFFLRFGIRNGVKRVKLATLLYRSQKIREAHAAKSLLLTGENSESPPK